MPGLYAHVPFCARKCGYCDFYSFAPSDAAQASDRYLEAMEREADCPPGGFSADTVFIGGGTPTWLSPSALERLMRVVGAASRNPGGVTEWTVEANPGTLSPEKLRVLREGGADRISIGAQSFDPARLRALDRIHTPGDIAASVRAARAAGFEHISLDLIFAQAGQTAAQAEADVCAALALEPEHLSVYALTVEEGTRLHADVESGRIRLPDDDAARTQFDRIRARLTREGFDHYELSNYARPGRRCRHNLLYWSGGEYWGIGPSAHSHWRGARWGNVQSLDDWAAAWSKGWTARAFEERLDPESHARETLVFSLRLLEGVSPEGFREQTGFDLFEICGGELERLENEGWIERADGRVRLTGNALFISDTIFSRLI